MTPRLDFAPFVSLFSNTGNRRWNWGASWLFALLIVTPTVAMPTQVEIPPEGEVSFAGEQEARLEIAQADAQCLGDYWERSPLLASSFSLFRAKPQNRGGTDLRDAPGHLISDRPWAPPFSNGWMVYCFLSEHTSKG